METPIAGAGQNDAPQTTRRRRSPGTMSLAEQIRRAAVMAESEELCTQRRLLREDLILVQDLMARQRQEEAQKTEDLCQLQSSIERATKEAVEAEQEQQQLAQRLRGQLTYCHEGQQDLAKKLLAKMAELNEKLGANMMQLEDEVTAHLQDTVHMMRQVETECREALDTGVRDLTERMVLRCEEIERRCCPVDSMKAVETMRTELQQQKDFSSMLQEQHEEISERLQRHEAEVCSGCHEIQKDLKQLGVWLSEILHLPGLDGSLSGYEAPWMLRWAEQEEVLQKQNLELQSQRTLLDSMAVQLQEVKTAELHRQASLEAVSKQSSSLQSLRQKLQKERKDEASRRTIWEEEFQKLRGQIEELMIDLRKAQAETNVNQAAAMEEKQQALLRHCRAWTSDAHEATKEAFDERLREVVQELRSSGETLARETKQQCRGWVDAALGKLESLAIRSREQLATLGAELPFTVKRLVAEEMAPRKGKVKVTTSPRQVSRRSEAPAESVRPQTPPFELGEPLASATRPVDSEMVTQPAVTHHGLDRDVSIN